MSEPKKILVIDVPASASAEEIESQFALPLENDYSLHAISFHGGIIRGIYKLCSRRVESGAAATFIKQNPTMSVECIRTELAERGIKRSGEFIRQVRKDG